MAASEPWRQLHAASVAVNLFPTIYRGLRTLWPLALAVVVGGVRRDIALFEIGMAVLFLGLPIVRTIVHWATLRYRIESGNLVIQTGLLNRQSRTIPPERIQNIEQYRNVFHRLSGLVELRIETASGKDVEGMLSALDESEADRLIGLLRTREREPTEEVVKPLHANSDLELVAYGLSQTRWGLLLALFGITYPVTFGEDPGTWGEQIQSFSWWEWGGLAIAAIVGIWLFGAVMAVFNHHGFALRSYGDRLVAEQGLFTRRRVELPLGKVQVVSWHEPLLRRWLGYGSLKIGTAAARQNGGGLQQAQTLVPWVARLDLFSLLSRTVSRVPDLDVLTYRPPDQRALYRDFIRAMVLSVVFATIGVWWLGVFGVLLGLVGVLDALTSWLDHRHQGWWMDDRFLVSRMGWWTRTSRLVELTKLQSVEVVQGPLERRWDLARVIVRVAGAGVTLPILPWNEALAIERLLVKAVPSAPESSNGSKVAPALHDDEEGRRHQEPGNRFGHDAHEHKRADQDRAAVGFSAMVAPGVQDREQPEHAHEEGRHPRASSRDGGLAVEAELPAVRHSGLQEQDHRLEEQVERDGDLHSGDEDSQA